MGNRIIHGFRLILIVLSSFLIFSSFYSTKKCLVIDREIPIEKQINQAGVNYIINDVIVQTDSVFLIPNNTKLTFKNGGKLLKANLILGENVTILNGNIQIAENGLIRLNHHCRVKNCTFVNESFCRIGFGNLFADGSNDIIIKNCSFSPQKRQSKGKCSSIDLRNCDGFLIENVTSTYTEGENIIIYEGHGTVKRCYCTGGWSGIGTSIYGTSVKNPKPGNPDARIVIKNNTVKNTLAAGITINNYNSLCKKNTVLFENCTVNGPGIRLGHSHAPANNCTISGNTIKWIRSKPSGASTSNRGISLDAGNGNLIENNTIENVPEGIASSVYSKTGTLIRKNTIKGATFNGITIFEETNMGNSCVIKDNIISMSSGTGIWIRNCNSEISGNKIVFSEEKVSEGGSFSYVGIRIEDNTQIETSLMKNTIKQSITPIKATFRGKKVSINKNKYYTEKECSYTASENTVLEENNNSYNFYSSR